MPRRPQDAHQLRNSPWEDNRCPHDGPNSRVSVLGQGNKVLLTLVAQRDNESSFCWQGLECDKKDIR